VQNSESSKDRATTATFLVIGFLFFASGFSSLIYQVVWSRLLTFVFGSTTFATASVLAVFMGGLALGSFLAGRCSDRARNPLLWYGILEGIVGVWALSVPFLLDSATPLYKALWQQFHLVPLLFALLRFLVASIVLIVPTACMGATLPFVSRHVARSVQTIGSSIGSLYAINTSGAVCGAWLAGFVLLPALGLKMTTWLAAGINLALFMAVVALSRLASTEPEGEPQAETIAEKQAAVDLGKSSLSLSGWFAIAAFGISGGLAMVYEVGWTRALLLVIGSGTYAFTCMLTTFLIGIFLGSWFCARVIDRSKDPLRVFALLQISVALCALAALLCYSYLPIGNLVLGAFFAGSAEIAIASKFLCAAATFVPLTLFLGATFPAIVRACVIDLACVGRSVGTLYSANTCGAIVGAFLAGFLLVPWLGVEKMLLAAAACNFLLGSAMLFPAPSVSRLQRLAAMAIAIGLCCLAAGTPAVWDQRLLLLAQPLRRNHSDPRSIAAILFDPELRRQALAIIDVLYFADGISSNVGVVRMKDSGHSLLLTNGNIDGGDSLDMATQILLSLFPLVAKPDIQDVCVIGYGTGISTGTALCFPVKKVTSIELEKDVYAAARYFDHVNHRPYRDPRSLFEMDDGRNFLLTADQKFDLIVSEPSNPWQSGVCNLYTREYFEICSKHLKPGGLLSCWLQTTELSPQSIRSILSAIRGCFAQQLIFGTGSGPDVVILASNSPLVVDWQSIRRAFASSEARLQFQRSRLTTPAQVAACVKADTRTVKAICSKAEPNSDDRNYLEFAVCKTYETANFEEANRLLFDQVPVKLKDVLAAGTISPAPADLAEAALLMKRPQQAFAWASESPGEDRHLSCIAGRALWQAGQQQKARQIFLDLLKKHPGDDEALAALAQAAAGEKDGKQAADFCRKAMSANPENSFARYFLGLFAASPQAAASMVGCQDLSNISITRVEDPERVQAYLSKICSNDDLSLPYANALYLQALALEQTGKNGDAERLLRKYVQLQPGSLQGKRALSGLLWSQGHTMEAACLWAASFDAGRQQSKALSEEAEQLMSRAQFEKAHENLSRALELCPSNYKALTLLKTLSNRRQESKQLLKLMQESGAETAALQSQRIFEPPNDGLAKLIEVAAAGLLLWMALRKGGKKG
jgi:spermidine synthase